VRLYLALPLRGKSRLRNAVKTLLRPDGGVERLRVGSSWITLSHDNEATRNMAYGVYESNELAIVRRHIRDGDVVVDVGANVGYMSAHFARYVGHSGKVFAFEPSPTAFALLMGTEANNVLRNLFIYNMAVSDHVGKASYFETEAILSHGYGRLDRRPSDRFAGTRSCSVNVTTIDAFATQEHIDLARLRLVKIDVEGHEDNVINGMRNIFSSGVRPALLTEFSGSSGNRVGDFGSF